MFLNSQIVTISMVFKLDYAEHLKKLKKSMYSIQRRNERFKIIYKCKIKEGLVPNISNKNGLTSGIHVRHECRCNMPILTIKEKQGMHETAHSHGPYAICGTRFPNLFEIFLIERLSISKQT